MAQTDIKPSNTTATDTKTDTKPTATESADRGDVGVVTIRKSTREITSVRTRTSTDPIHVAVKDAIAGEWYDIDVDNDATKIDRVARKLRAAAQKYDVGMNIHPDHPKSDVDPSKVVVSFRTGERDKRAAKPTETTGATETKPTTTDAKPTPTTTKGGPVTTNKG